MTITALTYAKNELKAGRFPTITIYTVCGEHHLADSEYRLLRDPSFKTHADAVAARSKILDKAGKLVNR